MPAGHPDGDFWPQKRWGGLAEAAFGAGAATRIQQGESEVSGRR